MDIYVTGKIKNNVMYYAAYSMSIGYVEGTVQATDKIEGQLYGMGAALIKALERKKDPYVNIHTDFEAAVKYANGAYKPVGDVSKRYVKKIKSLCKSNGCEFSFDTNLSKERAEKLFNLAYSTDKEQKIEKPLAKKKKEVQPNRMYQNWISNKPSVSQETTNKPASSEKDTLAVMEQEMWDWYGEQLEKERLQKIKENIGKLKEEKPREEIPYNDDPYINYVNTVYGNKDVEYDENNVNWRIRIYDKSGNLTFDLADRPYPGQTRNGVVVPQNDWIGAVWQGCFDEQVNGYTVKREGKISENSFNDDRFKYFFIFGKNGNTYGMLSADRKSISIKKKKDDKYCYFYDGAIELDFANAEESAWKKFSGTDFEEARQSFNEFFDTISDDCKSYINKFYEKNKEEQERKEKELTEIKEEIKGEQAEQEEPEFESENEDQMTLFDL